MQHTKSYRHLACITLAIFSGYSGRSQDPDSPESHRLKYHHPGLIVDLGVGLWANPIPVDWNRDGVPDLLLGAEDGFFYYFPREKP